MTPAREERQDYHDDYTHVSHGMMQVFRESPALYRDMFVDRTMPRPEPTPDMVLGSLMHAIILEPDAVNARFAAVSCKERRGKVWAAAFLVAVEAGKIAIPEPWADQARSMAAAVREHPLASELLKLPGVAETPIRWQDASSELMCKCLPDYLTETPICIDLKTTVDPKPGAFARQACNLGYHRSAAHYLEGVLSKTGKPGRYVFIVVGKSVPHDVYVYELSADALHVGAEDNASTLWELTRCYESDEWLAPEQKEITILELPRWARSIVDV